MGYKPCIGRTFRGVDFRAAGLEIQDVALETEIKVLLEEGELDRLRGTLREVGALQVVGRSFEENLLFDDAGSSLTENGCALRLRCYGGTCAVTFKGQVQPDRQFKKRPEFQVLVSESGAMRQILESLGLRVVFRYDKYREKWELSDSRGPVEICLDETPIGDFIEIEAEDVQIRDVAARLGLDETRFVRENYVDLYLLAGLGEP